MIVLCRLYKNTIYNMLLGFFFVMGTFLFNFLSIAGKFVPLPSILEGLDERGLMNVSGGWLERLLISCLMWQIENNHANQGGFMMETGVTT